MGATRDLDVPRTGSVSGGSRRGFLRSFSSFDGKPTDSPRLR